MNEEICLLFFFLYLVNCQCYLLFLFTYYWLLFFRLSRSTANHRLNCSERISFATALNDEKKLMSGSWAQLFNFFFIFLEYSKTNCAYFTYWSHTEVNNMLRRNFYREKFTSEKLLIGGWVRGISFQCQLPCDEELSHFFSIFSSPCC